MHFQAQSLAGESLELERRFHHAAEALGYASSEAAADTLTWLTAPLPGYRTTPPARLPPGHGGPRQASWLGAQCQEGGTDSAVQAGGRLRGLRHEPGPWGGVGRDDPRAWGGLPSRQALGPAAPQALRSEEPGAFRSGEPESSKSGAPEALWSRALQAPVTAGDVDPRPAGAVGTNREHAAAMWLRSVPPSPPPLGGRPVVASDQGALPGEGRAPAQQQGLQQGRCTAPPPPSPLWPGSRVDAREDHAASREVLHARPDPSSPLWRGSGADMQKGLHVGRRAAPTPPSPLWPGSGKDVQKGLQEGLHSGPPPPSPLWPGAQLDAQQGLQSTTLAAEALREFAGFAIERSGPALAASGEGQQQGKGRDNARSGLPAESVSRMPDETRPRLPDGARSSSSPQQGVRYAVPPREGGADDPFNVRSPQHPSPRGLRGEQYRPLGVRYASNTGALRSGGGSTSSPGGLSALNARDAAANRGGSGGGGVVAAAGAGGDAGVRGAARSISDRGVDSLAGDPSLRSLLLQAESAAGELREAALIGALADREGREGRYPASPGRRPTQGNSLRGATSPRASLAETARLVAQAAAAADRLEGDLLEDQARARAQAGSELQAQAGQARAQALDDAERAVQPPGAAAGACLGFGEGAAAQRRLLLLPGRLDPALASAMTAMWQVVFEQALAGRGLARGLAEAAGRQLTEAEAAATTAAGGAATTAAGAAAAGAAAGLVQAARLGASRLGEGAAGVRGLGGSASPGGGVALPPLGGLRAAQADSAVGRRLARDGTLREQQREAAAQAQELAGEVDTARAMLERLSLLGPSSHHLVAGLWHGHGGGPVRVPRGGSLWKDGAAGAYAAVFTTPSAPAPSAMAVGRGSSIARPGAGAGASAGTAAAAALEAEAVAAGCAELCVAIVLAAAPGASSAPAAAAGLGGASSTRARAAVGNPQLPGGSWASPGAAVGGAKGAWSHAAVPAAAAAAERLVVQLLRLLGLKEQLSVQAAASEQRATQLR